MAEGLQDSGTCTEIQVRDKTLCVDETVSTLVKALDEFEVECAHPFTVVASGHWTVSWMAFGPFENPSESKQLLNTFISKLRTAISDMYPKFASSLSFGLANVSLKGVLHISLDLDFTKIPEQDLQMVRYNTIKVMTDIVNSHYQR